MRQLGLSTSSLALPSRATSQSSGSFKRKPAEMHEPPEPIFEGHAASKNGPASNKRRRLEAMLNNKRLAKPALQSPDKSAPFQVNEGSSDKHLTVDICELRPKIRAVLIKSFGNDTDKDSARKVVEQIEATAFSVYGSNVKSYQNKLRSILGNLRNNPELRRRLLSGAQQPAEIVEMDEKDLADEKLKQVREANEKASKDEGVWGAPKKISSSQHQCPSCEGFQCQYMLVASRRYFAKCETWGRKDAEQDTLRLECTNCGHEWTRVV